MKERILSKDEPFIVKEFVLVDVIVALVFYGLFFYGLFNTTLPLESKRGAFYYMLLFALVPAIIFSFKAANKKSYLTINMNGIYIGEFYLTDWKNFVSARIEERPEAGSFSDNFVLIIDYYRENLGYYVKEVSLASTQDKSEEEIIDAINYFYGLSAEGGNTFRQEQ